MFTEGLTSIMEEAKSKNSFKNEEYAGMILNKPEDGVKYVCRILVEKEKFISITEHNYVPVWFTKSSGEKTPGWSSFLCTKDPECPICNKTAVYKDNKTGKEEVKTLKPRSVLAIPVFVREEKTAKRGGGETINKTEDIRILILPPGKGQVNWKQIQSSADERGTLKDRYYVFSRSGKGTDTTWTITSREKEEIEKENLEGKYLDIEIPDVKTIVKESGLWKPASDVARTPIISGDDTEEVKEFLDVVDKL